MLGENPEDNYFLVTSYGRTATYWIAKILHDHPDIICSHGAGFPPFFPSDERTISEQAVLEMHRNLEYFQQMPLEKVLHAHKNAGKAKVYGNVHGYSANSVRIITIHNKMPPKVNVVNIVRHPVTRIESFRNRMLHELNYNYYLRDKIDYYMKSTVDEDLLTHIKDTYGMTLSISDKLFIYALCLVPFNDKLDFASDIPSIPMERLTKDPEAFCWMFNVLTHGKVAMNSAYLANAYNEGRLNALSNENNSLNVYLSWEEWMCDSFAYIAKKHDFPELYNKQRYSFSFIKNI